MSSSDNDGNDYEGDDEIDRMRRQQQQPQQHGQGHGELQVPHRHVVVSNTSGSSDNDDDEREADDGIRSLARRHPYANLIVPGPFVVLQGVPGDGMSSTMSGTCGGRLISMMTVPTRTATAAAGTASEEGAAATSASSSTTRLNPAAAAIPAPSGLSMSAPSSIRMTSGIGGASVTSGAAASLGCGIFAPILAAATTESASFGAVAAAGTARSAAATKADGPFDTTMQVTEGEFTKDGRNGSDDDDDDSSMVLVASSTGTTGGTSSDPNPGIARRKADNDNVGVDNDPMDCTHEETSDDHGDSEQQGASPNRSAAAHDATEEDRLAITKWEEECRRIENEQHQEWIESLAGEHVHLKAIMLPPPALATTASASTSSSSLSSQQGATQDRRRPCWWRDQHTGRLIVFDSSLLGGDDGALMAAVLDDPAVVRTTLAPGTQVMATKLHTLDVRTGLPVQGDAGSSLLTQGEPGTLQLLHIESPLKGLVVLSWNGYCFLAPGTPEQYTAVEPWIWRVTCPSGAFVRQGLYLGTKRVAIVPYGHLLTVDRKTVNAQGLSRLRVEYVDSRTGTVIRGWCSEFLNPVSGQRGPILQPLPFPVPALYRVVLDEGAVLRTGIELSSPVLGRANKDAVLCVTSLSFSEHPQDRCLQRLGLAGDGGVVSLRLNKPHPEDLYVLEMVDVHRGFDSNRPGDFHLGWMRMVHAAKEESHRRANQPGPGRARVQRLPSSRLSPDVSSIDEDENGSGDDVDAEPRPDAITTSIDCGINIDQELMAGLVEVYSPAALQTSSPTSRSPAHGATGSSSPGPHQHSSRSGEPYTEGGGASVCLICLCEDRTATLVHGETGHICCCLMCARILKARGDGCPVCRLPIDLVVQHFWA